MSFGKTRSEGTETVVISRRELARELRRKAYRDAKARRDADPRFIAMKEAAKVRRREMDQVAKERKKAAVVAAKERDKSAAAEQRAGQRQREREQLARRGSLGRTEADVNEQLATAKGALARALGVAHVGLGKSKSQSAQHEAAERETPKYETAEHEPVVDLLERLELRAESESVANDR